MRAPRLARRRRSQQRGGGDRLAQERVARDVEDVAVEPRGVELAGLERRRDAAVGGERAVAVGADDRDDDAGRPGRDRPDELDAARRELAREQLSRSVVAALGDAPRVGAERRRPGGDVRRLPARAGPRGRAHVPAGSERLVEPHDHVEHHVAEGCDPHSYNRPMEGEDRAARLRSFLIGGLVGASAAVATARRRRDLDRRRRERRLHPIGLAAFEEAPCFREMLEQEREQQL